MNSSYADQVKSLAGVIFDLDGTLVDSQLDFTALRQSLDCPAELGVLEFIDTLPDRERAGAHEAVLAFEQQGADRATLMPGARACLETLRHWQLPVAILTRNAGTVARHTLQRLGFAVDLLLAREDCAPKPAPDGLLQIAGHWNVPAQNCVYVGDYLFDLQAARNAGMLSCYYDPHASAEFSALADWHIRHLAQLHT
ncbi:MAG: HAD family hydrolase [Alcanivoracaceae bacterium]|nr:HAD family hydrolase [Alcanivoracaceae bacterium]